jgi:hypothetical protein
MKSYEGKCIKILTRRIETYVFDLLKINFVKTAYSIHLAGGWVTKNQLQDCLLSKGSNEILSSHLLLHSQ